MKGHEHYIAKITTEYTESALERVDRLLKRASELSSESDPRTGMQFLEPMPGKDVSMVHELVETMNALARELRTVLP